MRVCVRVCVERFTSFHRAAHSGRWRRTCRYRRRTCNKNMRRRGRKEKWKEGRVKRDKINHRKKRRNKKKILRKSEGKRKGKVVGRDGERERSRSTGSSVSVWSQQRRDVPVSSAVTNSEYPGLRQGAFVHQDEEDRDDDDEDD